MNRDPGETRGVTEVAPNLVDDWISADGAILVDVREDFEHAEERIPGAVPHPLSKFDSDTIRSHAGNKRVVFHCRSGKRSREAAERFRRGDEAVFHLAGGIEGWKSSGRGVLRPQGEMRIPVMRQVQIAAGMLVVVGVALGATIDPWWLALAGFVGGGLMFAGLTGWCGMAKLLAVMPWNRTRSN